MTNRWTDHPNGMRNAAGEAVHETGEMYGVICLIARRPSASRRWRVVWAAAAGTAN